MLDAIFGDFVGSHYEFNLMTFEDACELVDIDLNDPDSIFFTQCSEYENCFVFGWKEPTIANVRYVFKNDCTKTYDPAFDWLLYAEPGELVREYDLEALAKEEKPLTRLESPLVIQACASDFLLQHHFVIVSCLGLCGSLCQKST